MSEDRFTIDELARSAGMTVRNVRAHQTRGLLPAPTIEARTGYYDSEHLARLQLIKEMQDGGFNLAAIKSLLESAPVGSGKDLLEFQRAILRPWQHEEPRIYDIEDLAELYGHEITPEMANRAQELGLVTLLDDGRVEVHSPSLIKAGAEVVAMGVPLEKVNEVFEELMEQSRTVARTFVEFFIRNVWKPFEEGGSPEQDLPRVRAALDRLRPVASQALLSAFHMTMTAGVEAAFGAEIERNLRSKQEAS
ncbi:MAG: MerR family transcriptional regulator [Actinomycetota bacterium]|nr:MerR family transcriptional regulator [Actinomycetota bacterium]